CTKRERSTRPPDDTTRQTEHQSAREHISSTVRAQTIPDRSTVGGPPRACVRTAPDEQRGSMLLPRSPLLVHTMRRSGSQAMCREPTVRWLTQVQPDLPMCYH